MSAGQPIEILYLGGQGRYRKATGRSENLILLDHQNKQAHSITAGPILLKQKPVPASSIPEVLAHLEDQPVLDKDRRLAVFGWEAFFPPPSTAEPPDPALLQLETQRVYRDALQYRGFFEATEEANRGVNPIHITLMVLAVIMALGVILAILPQVL